MAQRNLRIAIAQLLEPPIQRPGNAGAPHRGFVLHLFEELEKVLEVIHLVIANMTQHLAQHRLVTQIAQRMVVSRGAGLHHAARYQFKPLIGIELFHGAQLRILGKKTVIGLLPRECGPHRLYIGPQGSAVLQLLGFPLGAEPVRNLGPGRVMFGQISGIGI